MSRFVRPPPSAPEPGPPYLDHYPPYLQDRVVSSQYTQPQQYPPMGQPIYPPHYDSRRVYPPVQPYQREEMVRGSPVPIEIPQAAVPSYVPESRDRYQQTESYCPVAPHLSQIRPSCHRVCFLNGIFVAVSVRGKNELLEKLNIFAMRWWVLWGITSLKFQKGVHLIKLIKNWEAIYSLVNSVIVINSVTVMMLMCKKKQDPV